MKISRITAASSLLNASSSSYSASSPFLFLSLLLLLFPSNASTSTSTSASATFTHAHAHALLDRRASLRKDAGDNTIELIVDFSYSHRLYDLDEPPENTTVLVEMHGVRAGERKSTSAGKYTLVQYGMTEFPKPGTLSKGFFARDPPPNVKCEAFDEHPNGDLYKRGSFPFRSVAGPRRTVVGVYCAQFRRKRINFLGDEYHAVDNTDADADVDADSKIEPDIGGGDDGDLLPALPIG